MSFINELHTKMASYAGVVYVDEEDEWRLRSKCLTAAITMKYNMFRWSATDGLVPVSDEITTDLRENGIDVEQQLLKWATIVDPATLLRMIKDWNLGPSLVLAYDLFTVLNRLPSIPVTTRLIKDITVIQRNGGAQAGKGPDGEDDDTQSSGICQLVICDRVLPELDTPLQRLTMELPNRREMSSNLDDVLSVEDPEVVEYSKQNRERILNSLMGLSAMQATNAIMEALSRTGYIDADIIKSYKKNFVATQGLTWVEADERGFDAIGGLDPLKNWFRMVYPAFNPELAAEYNLEPPKGINVAGGPGCGKSALVKALGKEWGLPIVRLDMGATRGMFQGQSENNFQRVIEICQGALAPCILWVDEMEKAFEGAASSGETDGGTGARVLQTFLTWLQDRTAPVFVYSAMNRPDRLPPEMLRAGRFDANFWVDFPTKTERLGIIEVYCKKYDKAVDIDRQALVSASEDCSGAEIEASFRKAAMIAMARRSPVTTEDIVRTLRTSSRVKNTFELSDGLKKWRDAAEQANTPDSTQATKVPAKTNLRRRRRVRKTDKE